jgi:DNA-binding XRE family transcriptional regulator
MKTHEEVIAALMSRVDVREEVDRIEHDESDLLDVLLKARHEAGLTQAEVARRMGTHAPAIARLERALSTGQHSPSLATLRKYAAACGKRLVLTVA